MKNFTLLLICFIFSIGYVNSQCTTTNATGCVCAGSGVSNCDLLPDMIVGEPPLLINGSSGVVEYSQTGNGSNDGLLRVSVSTPNIGLGPLECRGTNIFVCGTDTIVGTAPATCPNTGLPPKQLLNQRVYHKNGNVMTYYDRPAGTMTYHPSHGHQHVDDWGIYTLRTATTDPNPLNWPIIGTGAKLSFCLLDLSNCTSSYGDCVDAQGNILTGANMPNYGLGGGAYGCSQTLQGISAGYVDIYTQSLDGMYITIPPNTCNGLYYIVVQLDPNNNFLESNENNNVLAVPFTLTKQSGTVPSISVSGSTTICPGSSVVLTSSAAPSYLWSNGDTTQSITVTTSGNYSVTTDMTSSCSATSAPTTVTVQNLPVTAVPVSSTICPGQSTQINTTVIVPPNSNALTSFTNNTVFNIPDNNAIGVSSPVTVSGINPATLASGTIVSVQIDITHTYTGDLVVALVAPSGNTINLSNRRGGGGDNFSNTIFSMSAITAIINGSAPFNGSYIPDGAFSALTGNVNGNWQLHVTDLAGVDVGTINSWTITFNNLVTTQLNYTWSSVPTGFTSTLANPMVNPAANTVYTVLVTNLITGCTGTSSTPVAVDIINIATSGNAVICAGASTPLTASGAGTYSWTPSTGLSATNVASVNASPASTTTYMVTGTNPSGCYASQNVTVTVNPLPVVTLSAFADVCVDVPSFSLTGGSPSGGTYSGTGVTAGSFSATTAGVGSHAITYTYADGNGCEATAVQNILVKSCNCITPSTPPFITGVAQVCKGSTVTYSVNNNANVTNYNWVAPANATIASGQGTNAVTVSFAANYTAGNLCVAAGNACGTSAPKCKRISPVVSRTPGNVVGELNGNCNTTVSLSVPAVNGALSYDWSLPAGTTMLSGQGTNAITFTTPSGFTNGQVCVTAFNGCVNSNSRCVYIYGAPAKPIISGPASACAGQTGMAYSCNNTAGATTYTWGAPSGSTIVSGQGTNSVLVDFGAVAGKVAVTAKNACGNRGTATKSVAINCRLSEQENSFDVQLTPNPASVSTDVHLTGNLGDKATITITNVLGKDVYTETFAVSKDKSYHLDLSGYSKGIYLVTVSSGNNKKSMRLVVD